MKDEIEDNRSSGNHQRFYAPGLSEILVLSSLSLKWRLKL